jgi:Na+-transporting methylmalonyl-CoA/oxaloacetate decarboxylase gamma subunit
MNQNVAELLRQGLAIAVVGMGLVFGALALFWGAIILLNRVSTRATAAAPAPETPLVGRSDAASPQALTDEDQRALLAAERARVAAIVTGALMANAVSLSFEPPPGPTFEHGRTAPAWVTTNRARIMHPWQPPRFTEKDAGR